MANELQLIASKNIAGELETNLPQLEKFVAEKLVEYDIDKYNGDVVKAKKDRAELNASKKFLGESRKAIIAEYMKPVADFEARCKKLEANIDSVSKNVDTIVKAEENKEKQAKKQLIKTIWEVKNFNLVSLDKIFNEKWLNKTYKITDVQKDIENIIDNIYKDLKTLERFATDVETVKAYYLDCLDVGSSLDYGEQLEKNREKIAQEKSEREEREYKENLVKQENEIRRSCVDFQKKSNMASLVVEAFDEEGDTNDIDEVSEYKILLSCTEYQTLAIKEFLTQQGIEFESFEKIEF